MPRSYQASRLFKLPSLPVDKQPVIMYFEESLAFTHSSVAIGFIDGKRRLNKDQDADIEIVGWFEKMGFIDTNKGLRKRIRTGCRVLVKPRSRLIQYTPKQHRRNLTPAETRIPHAKGALKAFLITPEEYQAFVTDTHSGPLEFSRSLNSKDISQMDVLPLYPQAEYKPKQSKETHPNKTENFDLATQNCREFAIRFFRRLDNFEGLCIPRRGKFQVYVPGFVKKMQPVTPAMIDISDKRKSILKQVHIHARTAKMTATKQQVAFLSAVDYFNTLINLQEPQDDKLSKSVSNFLYLIRTNIKAFEQHKTPTRGTNNTLIQTIQATTDLFITNLSANADRSKEAAELAQSISAAFINSFHVALETKQPSKPALRKRLTVELNPSRQTKPKHSVSKKPPARPTKPHSD